MWTHFSAGAYWGPRQESISQCSQRIVHCLDALAKLGAIYEKWHIADVKPDVIFPGSETIVEAALANGRIFNDDGDGMPELGWQLHLSNGRSGVEGRSLSIHCGSWSVVGNLCVLEARKSQLEAVLPNAQAAEDLILAIALPWNADWAKVSDYRITNEIDKVDQTALDGYQPGWIMYRAPGIVDDVVWPGECERAKAPGDEGELIVTSKTPEEAFSQAGITRLLRIGRALAASKKAALSR